MEGAASIQSCDQQSIRGVGEWNWRAVGKVSYAGRIIAPERQCWDGWSHWRCRARLPAAHPWPLLRPTPPADSPCTPTPAPSLRPVHRLLPTKLLHPRCGPVHPMLPCDGHGQPASVVRRVAGGNAGARAASARAAMSGENRCLV